MINRVGFVHTIDGTFYERDGMPVFVRQNADGLWESESGWCYTGELVIERFEFDNLPIIFYKPFFAEWKYNSIEEIDLAISEIGIDRKGFYPRYMLANLRILRQQFMYEKWLDDVRIKWIREA